MGSDGKWSIVVHMAVGHHDMKATQTVNSLPHVGLTSAVSCDLDVYVYPDAPVVSPILPLASPTTTTLPVTVKGTGTPTYTVTLYDNGDQIVSGIPILLDGSWSYTGSFRVGVHSFTATQTSTSFPNYGKFTSAQGSASSVTVYAPTPDRLRSRRRRPARSALPGRSPDAASRTATC